MILQPQKRAILLSLIVGIVLMLAKFVAYFLTSSNAILTDAAESIVNVAASSFAFYSIYLAAQPKDQNHPYGHGKVEFFSVFIEGALIIIAGILIVSKSIYNLFVPNDLEYLLSGTIIIAATGLVNYVLGYYLVNQGNKLHSLTLHADGKHLQVDALSSAGLIVGLLIIYFTGIEYIDSVLSVLLGLYVIYNGYKLLRGSVGGLMDESDTGIVQSVVDIMNANRRDPWIDLHNLRTQRYGTELHIDCHLTLPYYFDLNQVHEEVSAVDKLINAKAPLHTELFIHADPCLPQCCHYCRMQNCPVRSEEKRIDITWNIENSTKNKKHFDREVSL